MKTKDIFETQVDAYEQWYEDYPEVYQSEVLALQEQFLDLPEQLRGIEVGLGTGRFSEPLGIKEGVEPSANMRRKAFDRGIEVIDGTAEHLPYAAMHFDFVLFVTICHLDNLRKALSEAFRVLKPGGTLIIGFLDRYRPVAQSYLAKRHHSEFYAKANFYAVEELQTLMKRAGFKTFVYNQTLFGNLDEIKEVQAPREGFGTGSFVTVRASKP